MRRPWVFLVCLLFIFEAAAADEKEPASQAPKPLTQEQAADAVLAAVKTEDAEALEALAKKDAPDPWLVADLLCYRGEHDTAAAFAKAAPRVDVEKLPAYVEAWRKREPDTTDRERLAAGNAAASAKQFEKVVELTEDLGPPRATVIQIRRQHGRASALVRVRRFQEGMVLYQETAKAALALGWLARAANIYGLAARSAQARSAWALAIENMKEWLAVSERRGDKKLAARARGDMGIAYFSLGQPAEALVAFKAAIAAFEAVDDRVNLGGTLVNMAHAQFQLGEVEPALASATRGMELLKEAGHLRWYAAALQIIGTIHTARGDYPLALEFANRSLEAMTSAGNRAGAALSIMALARLHERTGEYKKALPKYEQALKELESLGDTHRASWAVANIGLINWRLGRFAKALSTLQHALVQFEALGDSAAVAGAHVNLGNVYSSLGEYDKALSSFERGLELAERIGHRQYATNAIANIGHLHLGLAQYDKGISAFKRALARMRALGNKNGVAGMLVNIGLADMKRGNLDQALVSVERGFELAEQIGQRAWAANALSMMGNIHSRRGNYERALAAHEQALERKQSIGDRVGTAQTLVEIGAAHRANGDETKARSFVEQGMRAAKSLRATPTLVTALTVLARIHLDAGRPSRALSAAQKALDGVEDLLGGLGAEEGATAREQYVWLFALGTLSAVRDGDLPEALAFLESGRAGALLDALDKREVLRWKAESLPSELRLLDLEARDKERAARSAYDRAAKRGNLEEIKAAARVLDEASEAVRKVAGRIQRELKQQAGLFYPRASTLEEIKEALHGDQAAVLYGLFLDEDDDLDEALALVLRRDGERVVPLGKASAIATACEALALTDASTDPSAALDALRKLVVHPLKLGKDVKRLLVSPEGSLCYLPVGALFTQSVAMTPSGTTHVLLLSEERAKGEGILALGNPDYDGASKGARAIYYRGRALSPLPATRKEVETVGTQTLLGGKASEAGLEQALRASKRWRAVHFACHGLVDIDRPMLSSLALSRAGEDDGFLTALEILRTKIPADLAVLSACETGKGKIVKGEGIVGLTRAFMFAGAPRVICSLWKVEDEATQALMVKFYELWNPKEGEGLPAAAALQQAQAFIRDFKDKSGKHKWKHPYYWAAWVLWGLPN